METKTERLMGSAQPDDTARARLLEDDEVDSLVAKRDLPEGEEDDEADHDA